MQKCDESLNTALLLYNGIVGFVQKIRDDFENLEKEAGKIKEVGYDNHKKRQRTRKLFFGEIKDHNDSNILRARESFKVNVFFVICDSLISDTKTRSEVYKNVNSKFKTILDYGIDINTTSFEDLKIYKTDVNMTELKNELIQFRACIKHESIKSPESMYLFIQNNSIVATFPNLNTI